MKTLFLPVFATLILFTAGCKKDHTPSTPVNTDSTKQVDVYVSGTVGDFTSSKAAYWKNDTLVDVSASSMGNYAYGMAVSGNDIYLAGGLYQMMGYWKNGVFTALDSTSSFPQGNSIYLNGNDVYERYAADEPEKALYKNNVRFVVITDTERTQITGVSFIGSDIYICGNIFPSGKQQEAAYWKNGQRVSLTDGSRFGTAVGIATSGNDVYVAGDERDASGQHEFVVLWKNGVRTILSDSSALTFASSIAANGSVVAVGGNRFIGTFANAGSSSVAMFWKNGTKTELTPSADYYTVTSIAVNGDDVYCSLNQYIQTGTKNFAKYSKNTTITTLDDSETANAWEIVLVKK